MINTAKQKCVFFDRDGIVNESPGPGRYVTRWEDFRLLPAFPVCLQSVLKSGYQAAIVTNQRAVARGLMTVDDVENIHQRLKQLLMTQFGLTMLDMVFCPHDENECSCRKPNPGMILALAEKFNLDLAKSWMVGDSETDVEAGLRAGCRTILVASDVSGSRADVRVPSMTQLSEKMSKILSA